MEIQSLSFRTPSEQYLSAQCHIVSVGVASRAAAAVSMT